MHKTVLHTLVLAAALSAPAMAAPRGDWDDVAELQQGAQIEVVHGALLKTAGRLAAVDANSISVQTESGLRSLNRADVRRVTVQRVSRKRRVLVGALIGAAAGTAIAAIGGANDAFEVQTGIVAAATATAGAGIGAGVGAVTGGPRTVYRSSE